jgi:hypothetical protein
MSNDPSSIAETGGEPAEPKPTAAEGANPLRLIVLLLVFGIALAGLLYDYTVARPAIKKANQDVQGCFTGTTPDPDEDGTFTDDEVQDILQRKPWKIENLENGKIEIYKWRSGLPFRPYKLWVVYSGRQVPLLHFASTSEPNESELPSSTRMTEPTDEALENFQPVNPSAGPGEGPGGKAAKGGKKGKKTAGNEQGKAEQSPSGDQADDEQAKQ